MAQFGDSSIDLNAILKQLYPDDNLPMDSAYKSSRLLGMLAKVKLAGQGLNQKIPVQIGNVGSVSATFSDAIGANQTGPKFRAFEVDLFAHYAGAGITGLAMSRAGGDAAAFAKAVDTTVKSATYGMGRKNSQLIYGNGNGKAGTVISSSGAAVVINHRDARNFEAGQRISFTNPTTGALIGAVRTIVSIDRHTNISAPVPTATLTLDSAPSVALAAADLVVRAGDHGGVCMYGLESWVPTDRSNLSTPFCGVDRSVDPERLAGISADLSALTPEDALVRALRVTADAGCMSDVVMCSPTFFEEVSNRFSARDRSERMVVKSFDGVHGYSALTVVGGGSGEVRLVMDPDCPDDRIYVLELDTWEIDYAGGGLPFIEERDGQKFLRSATSDGMDLRIVQYANLICHAPGRNGSFKV